MDKSRLIANEEYQTTHGCKVLTSNDVCNISMDEICEVMDISVMTDNIMSDSLPGENIN